jgi:hypothetical protein
MTPDFGKLLSGVFDLVLGAITEPGPASETEAAPAKRDYRSIVKLIHADELGGLAALPRCQDFGGIRLDEYEREHARIDQLKRDHRDAIAVLGKAIALDRDDLTSYERLPVAVSPFFWRKLRKIALPPPKYEQTAISASAGEIVDGQLVARAGWLKRKITVEYKCPMRVRHREELESLERKISEFSASENQAIDEIATSRFAHPVLFISHRWEATEHPDPAGRQLERLRALKDCFIIYDYTSFPQKPMSELEACDLDIVLDDMGALIRNVVVMDHPNYVTRGWCIYEYIAGCFEGSIVCDEIGDPRFVALRDWTASKAPISQNLYRDGAEALMSNHQAQNIFSAVNEILPSFKASEFSVEQDRAKVKRLLKTLLKRKLPAKGEFIQYFGEASRSAWTDEELEDAFEHQLQWKEMDVISVSPIRLKVAPSISEAVNRRYKIEKDKPLIHIISEMGNPLAALFREKKEDPAVWDAIRARRTGK